MDCPVIQSLLFVHPKIHHFLQKYIHKYCNGLPSTLKHVSALYLPKAKSHEPDSMKFCFMMYAIFIFHPMKTCVLSRTSDTISGVTCS